MLLPVLLVNAVKVVVFCVALGYDIEYAVTLPELLRPRRFSAEISATPAAGLGSSG